MEVDSKEKIRAFLALPLAGAFEAAVRPLLETLKVQYPEVKWVQPSQIHVTLHFFGGIGPEDVAKISGCVFSVTHKTKPLHLSLHGLGGFPNLERPRVLWGGIEGEVEALGQLQASLEGQFKSRGFECEKRLFKSHLTLGRVREGKRTAPIKNVALGPTESKQVSEIILFKSVLTPAGPEYEKLQTFPLSAA